MLRSVERDGREWWTSSPKSMHRRVRRRTRPVAQKVRPDGGCRSQSATWSRALVSLLQRERRSATTTSTLACPFPRSSEASLSASAARTVRPIQLRPYQHTIAPRWGGRLECARGGLVGVLLVEPQHSHILHYDTAHHLFSLQAARDVVSFQWTLLGPGASISLPADLPHCVVSLTSSLLFTWATDNGPSRLCRLLSFILAGRILDPHKTCFIINHVIPVCVYWPHGISSLRPPFLLNMTI